MKCKTFIFIALIQMFTIQLEAQNKTDVMVFGDVREKTTGKHIPYAQIVLKGTRYGTMADGSGHYKMANLPEGEYTLLASAMGYKSQEMTLNLKANTSYTVIFELDEDIFNLEQVVISGTRTPHFVKDAPVRTEVITAKAIEQKKASNLYEVLEGLPGVRVENQCQACGFSMVRMQGLGPEHTQMLINGQAVYSGLAAVYGLNQMTSEDIERVEVVKGSGSALYGSHAIGGAINIISQEPSPVPRTLADLRFGSDKSHSVGFQSSMRNDEGNLGLLVFARKNDEGALDQTGPGSTRQEVNHPDGFSDRVESKVINTGITFLGQDMKNGYGKIILRGKYIGEHRRGGMMTDDVFKNPYTPGTEDIHTQRYESELQYTRVLLHKINMNLATTWVNHQREATNDTYLNDYLSIHGHLPDVTTFRPYLAKENLFTFTLTLDRKYGIHHLMAGLQGMNDKIHESGMYVNLGTLQGNYGEPYRSEADKKATEWGLFLQDEWTPYERLTLVPGIRFDIHHSEEKYSASSFGSNFPESSFNQQSLNPRLAIKYETNKHLILRANVGTGYRAPFGFSEDLHLCSGSPRVWKSSTLLPEKSFSYNFSADYSTHSWALSFNAFHTRLLNKIGFVPADEEIRAMGYDYQWKNIDNATVEGLELAIKYLPLKGLELYADAGLNRGRFDQTRTEWTGTTWESVSRYIPRVPFVSGYFRVVYEKDYWTFNTSLNYQGTMYIDYYNLEPDPIAGDQSKIKKTQPFALLNARIQYQLKSLKIYAGANNITNYIQDERHLDDAAFIYAPLYGRIIFAGLSLSLSQ